MEQTRFETGMEQLKKIDGIDLLTPTSRSEAGYRLYDDKALEVLRQILFFREFDISLREIKSVMENPALDKKQILQMQRTMLTAKEETQKSWAKLIEWHGSKEDALETAKNPIGEEMLHALRLRQKAVMDKLAKRKDEGFTLDSFEIRKVVAEYGFVQKQLFRIKYEKDFMLQLADIYQNNKEVQAECDGQYGEGVTEFFAEAIRHFYSE